MPRGMPSSTVDTGRTWTGPAKGGMARAVLSLVRARSPTSVIHCAMPRLYPYRGAVNPLLLLPVVPGEIVGVVLARGAPDVAVAGVRGRVEIGLQLDAALLGAVDADRDDRGG